MASKQNGPCDPDATAGVPLPPTLTPGWIVGGTQVDEEVPGPARDFQQVLHAPQVHPQKAGPAPDGDHAPRSHPHIIIVLGQLHHLPVQVVGPLRKKGMDGQEMELGTKAGAPTHLGAEPGREQVAGLQLLIAHAILDSTSVGLNLPSSSYLSQPFSRRPVYNLQSLCSVHPDPLGLPDPQYLIHVDIKEVLLMVDSLEKTLELADGTAMNHQHVGDADWRATNRLLDPSLFPLDARAHLA